MEDLKLFYENFHFVIRVLLNLGYKEDFSFAKNFSLYNKA